MKYPLNLMMLFINFEKEIGDDLQGGLTKLKQIMEQDLITAVVILFFVRRL